MNNDSPYVPKRDLKVERAIGRFITAWGVLEREIDNTIHSLLLTDVSTGIIVTANLAIRAKLDLAHALFENLRSREGGVWSPVSLEWERRFDALINQTAKANAESRNPIVHSQPFAISIDAGVRPVWLNMAARKGGWRGSGVTYTKSYLDKKTETVLSLAKVWADAQSHWRHSVHAIRCADADELLSRSPDDPDPLTLQLQSSHDSPKPNPKPKRPKKPSRQA